jgi:hydroxymethylpyrimidine/phosphomethylpyrimidine kinase
VSPYRDPFQVVTGGALPDVLICSGLDPSGGAGLIADVRVVSALGARPVGVVTSQTVQDTQGMRSYHDVDPDVLGAQLVSLLSDIEVRAVKIGLVPSRAVATELGNALELTGAPVVWDPVNAPSLGDIRLDRNVFDDTLAALGRHLTLITPNVRELAELGQRTIRTLEEAIAAGAALAAIIGAAVLVKGGHLATTGTDAIDVLIMKNTVEELRGPRIARGEDVHGTGCALSSAIAAHLARGFELVEACRAAKQFVASRIATPVRPGRGAAAVV